MPCFRDLDNLVYGKSEAGGFSSAATSRTRSRAGWTECLGITPASPFHRPRALRAAHGRRRPALPLLARRGVVALICHPDAMTPDGNPLLGPMPGVRGFWTAAGLSLNGFGGAGGIGKTVAEWITEGETELDVTGYRAWRFGARTAIRASLGRRPVRSTATTTASATRSTPTSGAGRSGSRPPRTAPGLGAVLDEERVGAGGLLRAGEAEPEGGADQRAFGFTKPPWFERLRVEHEAFRERVGIIDMTSFGKIEVAGPGALSLLERVDNRIDRPVGSVVYTQFLNDRAGSLRT